LRSIQSLGLITKAMHVPLLAPQIVIARISRDFSKRIKKKFFMRDRYSHAHQFTALVSAGDACAQNLPIAIHVARCFTKLGAHHQLGDASNM
jgi:hypothetical protein